MKTIIEEFDIFLHNLGLKFNAVIIGGAALNILDITGRTTKDVDCLDPEIPVEIKEASHLFTKQRDDLELDPNWLNNGPITLKKDLPSGWRTRTQLLYQGKSLYLEALGRSDFLKSKLFAYCDRTYPDLEDLKNMKPTEEELLESIEWVKARDGNPLWPAHVEEAFLALRKALGYE